MRYFFSYLIILISQAVSISACSQPNAVVADHVDHRIIPAAERMDVYLPLLKGKRVAVFANHTSLVANTNLVDTLVKRGVDVKVVFGPEHGFRGTADAGEKVGNYVDEQTKVPVVSLYGSKRRPSPQDVADVDVLIFDIQDVGVRFYTYISSLEEYIEAGLENNKMIMILDRPNPNGFYVDGPVLEPKFKSFIGMQPVPIVYGMTMGEYAMMIAGEGWLSSKANEVFKKYKQSQSTPDTPFHFIVIKCENYTHKSKYELPVRPSPNLPEMQSIYLYPSTCLFEGTALNEGRGTEKPFQIFGHPSLPKNLYKFTPRSTEGAKNPKLRDQVCYGWNLHGTNQKVLAMIDNRIQLKWLINAYHLFPKKDSFFLANNFFNRLAGNDVLMAQIKQRKTESAIRASWQPGLQKFKAIRKKYLLYPDFE